MTEVQMLIVFQTEQQMQPYIWSHLTVGKIQKKHISQNDNFV